MKQVLLGLGTNKEFDGKSCIEILNCACKDLANLLKIVIVSSVYKTKAMYVTNQNDFYNMVVLGEVTEDYNPFDLLDQIHQIENKYGRDRKNEIRFGPRSLDIDIELFGKESINHKDLQIPHIRFKERAFVLVPMLEILDFFADDLLKEECKKSIAFLEDDVKTIEKVFLASDFTILLGKKHGSNFGK